MASPFLFLRLRLLFEYSFANLVGEATCWRLRTESFIAKLLVASTLRIREVFGPSLDDKEKAKPMGRL